MGHTEKKLKLIFMVFPLSNTEDIKSALECIGIYLSRVSSFKVKDNKFSNKGNFLNHALVIFYV